MTFFRWRRIGSLVFVFGLLLHLDLTPLSAQNQATASATWLYDLVQFDLPDVRSTRLGGINNQNDVVGSTFDGVRIRPFLVSGGVLSFPELPDGAFPDDVNDLGQIVGFLQNVVPGGAGPYRFVYSSGTWQFAGPLPPLLLSNSYARGINNHGDIVGHGDLGCLFCERRFAYFDEIIESGFSYARSQRRGRHRRCGSGRRGVLALGWRRHSNLPAGGSRHSAERHQ